MILRKVGATSDAAGSPHAELHTIILPRATAYNRTGAPAAMARIARALDAEDAAAALFDLAASLGAKLRLADLGCANPTWTAPPTSPPRIPLSQPHPVHPGRHPRAVG